MDQFSKKQSMMIKIELAVLALFNLLFWLLLGQVDIFQRIYPLIQKYQHYELDELLLLMPVLAVSCMLFAFRRWREAREYALMIEKQTRYDELTGLYNHDALERKVTQEFNRFKRYKEKFCILNLSIDKYSELVAKNGHEYVDDVVKNIALRIRLNLREVDVACRWGEDSFSVLCPVTLVAEAELIAKKLRSIIEEPMYDGLTITVCFGIMEIKDGINQEDVVKVADVALYQAKNQGPRNIVIAN